MSSDGHIRIVLNPKWIQTSKSYLRTHEHDLHVGIIMFNFGGMNHNRYGIQFLTKVSELILIHLNFQLRN